MVITSRTRNAVVRSGHVGSNPTFSAKRACDRNGCRLLNFLEIAVFTRFSVGRTAEYPGRTSAIFEKYRLCWIENRNNIQQFSEWGVRTKTWTHIGL